MKGAAPPPGARTRMLRRHCTPAVIAFSALLLCLSLPREAAGARETVVLGVLVASGAAGAAFAQTRNPPARRAGILLLACAAGCLLGLWSIRRMASEAGRASLPVPREHVSLFCGIVTQDSALSARGDTVLRVALRGAQSEKRKAGGTAHGSALVVLRGDYRFSIGERLEVRAGLAPFAGEGGESFIAIAERGGLRREGFSSGLWAARAEARSWLHRAVSRAGYPVSALMEALLIGSREDVPPDLSESFRKTGSLHILALSGLHVSVIYALLFAALGFLRSRGLKVVLAALVLLGYQFLAGFMPSLLRATVMIWLAGACLFLDRDAEPVNLLALSGILILLLDPFQAASLSFQLSYLALGGILLLGPTVQRRFEGRIPPVVLAPLAMSVGAQLATFPLVLARFGAWYPSGVAAGLVLVPLTTALLWAGLAWLLVVLIPWPLLHELGARALGLLYEAVDACARTMSILPGITLDQRITLPAAWTSAAILLCLAFLLPAPRPAALLSGARTGAPAAS